MTRWELLLPYLQMHPAIIPLILLMVINLIYSGARAIMGRTKPGDPGLLEFVWRKFSELLIVLISAIVETLVNDLPLVDVVALFYCATEVLEMLKMAIRDGLPVPDVFQGAVTALMGTQQAITPPPEQDG
jgi:phage-related holin